jgi:RimJ/RimL family protein N-acetyltransferase
MEAASLNAFNTMIIEPIMLEGSHVRLDPLSLEHVSQLCDVGLDPGLWMWTPTAVTTADEMRLYIQAALQMQNDGSALPFAIIDRSSGRAIGSTRFGNIERDHRRVEIGWTWIARPWQRSATNTESKYLMLRHAFEVFGCRRVEFKTDSLNERSRAAILRIGAKEEGILRNHMLTQNGRMRDTVYYSILDREWPEVKAGLEAKLRRAPEN